MKRYVVRKGKKVGIFSHWDEVKELVSGFSDAKYKSFPSQVLAEQALQEGYEKYYQANPKKNLWKEQDLPFEKYSIAVDAACSGNPGEMEYRGVDLQSGEEIFHQRFDLGTNNIGEFLAIVHGMVWLQERRLDRAIYSDSKIAMNWVREGKCKSQLRKKEPNLAIWDAVDRAEHWLAKYGITTTLLKWKTEDWGENPADFGRK
ncbi:MAG: ribonuclease H family protein [Candidatus Absconditabacteria bacterium]|nr:ribonuclease H family protein [Candidatus Absconditabacteria bacterium]MDD3868564.1 ribonuclease H family protein [Candidatus Absconditabacteria bacterium]MDD4714128.1 ribonuclease H family protein [Candidatus Absconditabacteria bacterium]